MKKLLAIAVLLLLITGVSPAHAIVGEPVGHAVFAVSSSAVSITSTICDVPAGGPIRPVTGVLLQVKDAAIYFTLHSASATPASVDYNGSVGTFIEVEYWQKFRAIRATGTDAAIKATCFRRP